MKIKEMCSEERPREKMLSKGPEALSNAELLAILLGSGTKDMNAVEVAQTLLSKAGGSMLNLARMSVEKLCEISGIGQKKAVSIKAAMELGKKFALEKPDQELKSIISSEMAYEIMLPTMIGLDHEECWVMYLNRANYLIKKEKASSGGLTATVIDTKEVVRKALEAQASGIILFHNHPSGNPRPGENDIHQTEILKKAVSVFDISLLDHIIIANDKFFSFADDKVTVKEPVIPF